MTLEMQTTNGSAPSKIHSDAVLHVPLAKLVESKTNPRKTFHGIDELAASMRQHGILSPLLARPKGDRYELVFGARRLRAARSAELATAPVMVREMGDREVLEAQIVENCQREDIHPLEEADSYKSLVEKHAYKGDDIAAKIGKSTAHVYQRLKLCALIPEGRDAFFEGKLSTTTALLIARIPHADLQKQAIKEITTPYHNGEPPSAGEAARALQRKFMLPLAEAPFSRTDTALVPAAGGCSGCEKRTGNQKELFGDVKSPDICTDPKCYEQKVEAAWKVAVAAAKGKGWHVLSEANSKNEFPNGAYLTSASSYVSLEDECYEDPKHRTWGELLKKAPPPITLARDDRGRARQLVDKTDAQKALKDAGYTFVRAPKKGTPSVDAKKEREKSMRRARIIRALTGAVVDKAEQKVFGDVQWKALVRGIIRATWHATLDDVLTRRAIDRGKRSPQDALLEAASRMKAGELAGLACELVMGRGNAYELGPTLREIAEALKVDVAKVSKESASAPEPDAKAPPARGAKQAKVSSKKKTGA